LLRLCAVENRHSIDVQADTMTTFLRGKDYADGQKAKEMTLSVVEFVRRFALHILPARLAKIRHFGLPGQSNLRQRLAQALLVCPNPHPMHP